LVPPSVINRPKQPYRAPDARCFVGDAAHDYVDDLISPGQILHDGIFNPVAVQKLIRKARTGGMLGVGDNMAVVGILSTQLLIHSFIAHFDPGS